MKKLALYADRRTSDGQAINVKLLINLTFHCLVDKHDFLLQGQQIGQICNESMKEKTFFVTINQTGF